jgi:N-acetylglucosaminyldiphosphoundecaprenol N-acetyl-beta-D-mannosaminyltransferase
MAASHSPRVLGVSLSAVSIPIALWRLEGWLADGEPRYVCLAPAHAIMDYRRAPELLRIANEAGMVTPDGMAIVWILRLMGHRNVERVYGPDLMLAACERSLETGWKHFFYGGGPDVAQDLRRRLEERFPSLAIAGTYTPPFRPLTPDEDRAVIEQIRASGADIVWVGISTPKQERWMAEHVGKVGAPVLIGVGAAFDFLSGHKPQAPRWMQRSGLEWLFRLGTEPRRLWRRYAEYPLFAALVAAQLLGLRRE